MGTHKRSFWNRGPGFVSGVLQGHCSYCKKIWAEKVTLPWDKITRFQKWRQAASRPGHNIFLPNHPESPIYQNQTEEKAKVVAAIWECDDLLWNGWSSIPPRGRSYIHPFLQIILVINLLWSMELNQQPATTTFVFSSVWFFFYVSISPSGADIGCGDGELFPLLLLLHLPPHLLHPSHPSPLLLAILQTEPTQF